MTSAVTEKVTIEESPPPGQLQLFFDRIQAARGQQQAALLAVLDLRDTPSRQLRARRGGTGEVSEREVTLVAGWS